MESTHRVYHSWMARFQFPVLVLTFFLVNQAGAFVSREELFADSDAGVRIHVREVRPTGRRACEPVLLVHGARVPGVASFDLPVLGGSLAADLADKGFCTYVMDIRGYGQSTVHSPA